MDLSRYLTLSNLYKLLDNNKIGIGILSFGLLFIFTKNIAFLLITVLTFLAVPFSIYMLLVLYLYQKRKWIYGYLIAISVSFLPIMALPNENLLFVTMKFSPFLVFVLYTMALRLKVGEWLIEIEHNREMNSIIHKVSKN